MRDLFYGQLAQSAYTTTPTFGAEDSACRAISKITADGLTIGFVGTNDAASVLADIEADVVMVEGLGLLHHGFWRAYSTLRAKLLALNPDVIYGHSEGGALALIYAADLCLHGKFPRAVYAFEPPRISADATIEDLFLDCITELLLTKNGDDPVPEVPRLLQDWQHPAPLTYIGQGSVLEAIDDHLIENVIASLIQAGL